MSLSPLTDQLRAEIDRVYPETGNDTRETAKRLRLSYDVVRNHLKRTGGLVARRVVTDSDRQEMVRLYANGLSTWKIGKQLGFLNVCVITNLKLAGVTLRSRAQAAKTYSVDQEHFATVETPAKAYMVGLFWADGNMSRDSLTLALQHRDEPLLKRIAAEIRLTGPLGFRRRVTSNHQDMAALRVYDQRFCAHLRALGIVERKTSKLTFPTWLKRELWSSFLLGLLDGDGCIYLNSSRYFGYTASFAGSQAMMEETRERISSEIGVVGSVRHGTGKGWTLTYTHAAALCLLNWLYGGGAPFCLERKRAKYLSILARLSDNPRIHSRTRRIVESAPILISHAA